MKLLLLLFVFFIGDIFCCFCDKDGRPVFSTKCSELGCPKPVSLTHNHYSVCFDLDNHPGAGSAICKDLYHTGNYVIDTTKLCLDDEICIDDPSKCPNNEQACCHKKHPKKPNTPDESTLIIIIIASVFSCIVCCVLCMILVSCICYCVLGAAGVKALMNRSTVGEREKLIGPGQETVYSPPLDTVGDVVYFDKDVPKSQSINVDVGKEKKGKFGKDLLNFGEKLGNKIKEGVENINFQASETVTVNGQVTESASISTDNTGGMNVNVIPQQPSYQQQNITSEYGKVDDNTFKGIIKAIKSENFSNEKKRVIKNAANSYYFTCEQLGQVIKVCSFDDERKVAIKQIGKKIIDPDNKYMLYSKLAFDEEKKWVDKYVIGVGPDVVIQNPQIPTTNVTVTENIEFPGMNMNVNIQQPQQPQTDVTITENVSTGNVTINENIGFPSMNMNVNVQQPHQPQANITVTENIVFPGMDMNVQVDETSGQVHESVNFMGMNMDLNVSGDIQPHHKKKKHKKHRHQPQANVTITESVGFPGMGVQVKESGGVVQETVQMPGMNMSVQVDETTGQANENVSFMGMNMNMNIPQQQQHHKKEKKHHQHYQHPSSVVDETTFSGIIKALKKENFSDDKKRIVKNAAKSHHFTCKQLGRVIKVCSFDDERKKAIHEIGKKIVDPQNKHELYSLVSFDEEKKWINKYIK